MNTRTLAAACVALALLASSANAASSVAVNSTKTTMVQPTVKAKINHKAKAVSVKICKTGFKNKLGKCAKVSTKKK